MLRRQSSSCWVQLIWCKPISALNFHSQRSNADLTLNIWELKSLQLQGHPKGSGHWTLMGIHPQSPIIGLFWHACQAHPLLLSFRLVYKLGLYYYTQSNQKNTRTCDLPCFISKQQKFLRSLLLLEWKFQKGPCKLSLLGPFVLCGLFTSESEKCWYP